MTGFQVAIALPPPSTTAHPILKILPRIECLLLRAWNYISNACLIQTVWNFNRIRNPLSIYIIQSNVGSPGLCINFNMTNYIESCMHSLHSYKSISFFFFVFLVHQKLIQTRSKQSIEGIRLNLHIGQAFLENNSQINLCTRLRYSASKLKKHVSLLCQFFYL